MKSVVKNVFRICFKSEVNFGIFLRKVFVKRIIEKHTIVIGCVFFRRKYFREKGDHFMFVGMLKSQQMIFFVMPIISMRHHVRKGVHSLCNLFLHRVEQIQRRNEKHEMLFKRNEKIAFGHFYSVGCNKYAIFAILDFFDN
jgi:hypothetical protein